MSKIKRKGDNFVRDALILCGITVVAGLLLALAYNITKKPIEEAKNKTEQLSYQAVLPEGKTFEEEEALNEKLEAFTPEGSEIERVRVAKDAKGEEAGYVFLVTSKEGYGGSIQFSMGVKMDGTIGGIEIIEMSETAGLGAKCVEDEFKSQYQGKSGEVSLVKGEASNENEVSAISGATITSKAITNAVNQVLKFVAGLEG